MLESKRGGCAVFERVVSMVGSRSCSARGTDESFWRFWPFGSIAVAVFVSAIRQSAFIPSVRLCSAVHLSSCSLCVWRLCSDVLHGVSVLEAVSGVVEVDGDDLLASSFRGSIGRVCGVLRGCGVEGVVVGDGGVARKLTVARVGGSPGGQAAKRLGAGRRR